VLSKVFTRLACLVYARYLEVSFLNVVSLDTLFDIIEIALVVLDMVRAIAASLRLNVTLFADHDLVTVRALLSLVEVP
jgi:hypothetical protein